MIDITSNTLLENLKVGDCFITLGDFKQQGARAWVWMLAEGKLPGWNSVNLEAGTVRTHALDTRVLKVEAKITCNLAL